MEQEVEARIDALQGQVSALMRTLLAVIQTLPQLQAAQGAVWLAIEKENAKNHDAADQTPPREAAERDSVLEALLAFLSSHAKQRD